MYTIKDNLYKNREYIVQQINAGVSTKILAKEFDCNSGTIWYFLKEIGISSSYKRHENHGKTNELKDQIINLYNSGLSCCQIEKQLGIKVSSLVKALNKWGIDTSRGNKINPNHLLKNHKDQAIELFNQGYSINKISKELNFSNASVFHLLNNSGFDTSKNRLKYTVNESFFEKIDTPEKATWLGWMYSDGNVDRYAFRIQLADIDKDILDKLSSTIEYNGPLHYVPAKNERCRPQYTLYIGRKKMRDDLVKLGCYPNKSLMLKFPTVDQVPEHLIWPFLLGIFDGDGSINIKNRGINIQICGSYYFTYELKDILKKYDIHVTNIYQRYKKKPKEQSAHQLFIGKTSESEKFYRLLYQYKDNGLFLNRKYEKFVSKFGE